MKKNKFLQQIIIGITTLLCATKIFAICPVCTIVVGAGVGLSHWLGIDDTITGLWIGGLTVSLIIWTIAWLDNKKIHFKGKKILTTIIYYVIIVLPLYPMGLIGHPFNQIWGFDKLIVGIIIGSIAFLGGAIWYQIIKKNNNGHAYFPFQKVVMPIAPLLILSILFFFITK